MEFLGYMMSGEGVETTALRSIRFNKEVQHFLSFANFYRCFIKDCSKICLPLTKSTSLIQRTESNSEIKAV